MALKLNDQPGNKYDDGWKPPVDNANDLEYISGDIAEARLALAEETAKIISGFIRKLTTQSSDSGSHNSELQSHSSQLNAQG